MLTEKPNKIAILPGPLGSSWLVIANDSNTVAFMEPDGYVDGSKPGNIIINSVRYRVAFYLEKKGNEWSHARNMYSDRAGRFRKHSDHFTEAANKQFRSIIVPWAQNWLETKEAKALRYHGELIRLEKIKEEELKKVNAAQEERDRAQQNYDYAVAFDRKLREKGGL